MDEPASSLVVVGASAGGVEALTTLAAGLPEDLDAAVCVVLHLPPGAESRLAHILSRAGPLPAAQARDGETLTPGRILVAPPDRHLAVRDGHALVVRGPHENGLPPSIDTLFRSAAVAYRERTVAVVLSGTRDDGVAGASAVGRRSGCVFGRLDVPGHAGRDDLPRPSRPCAPARRARGRDRPSGATPFGGGSDERRWQPRDEPRNRIRDSRLRCARARLPPGKSSVYSCPDCGGVLWEIEDGDMLRFRCRVGHSYTAEGTVEEQGASVEAALWTALRALQERAQLSERVAQRLAERGATKSHARFTEYARDARKQAELIRRLLTGADGDG